MWLKTVRYAATKQKGNVCFQAKVYTVNAAEIARPGDQIGLMVIDYARQHDTVYKVT